MSVDRDEVRRVAELAKLSLDHDEADRLTGEMNRILEYAERFRPLGSGPDKSGSDDGGARVEGGTPVQGGALGEDGRSTDTAGLDRLSGPDAPDALARGPETFAPEMEGGFFTVPPPPGVVGSDS